MTTSIKIMDLNGGEAGDFAVAPQWLEREKGVQAVHDAVTAFLGELRAGTASAKTRTEVRGGGAKPYRQKGTGRARAGSIRSPLWRGGGTTFGPTPRGYTKRLNKKVAALALRRAFTERLAEGALVVVEDIAIDEPKTKKMQAFLKAVGAGEDALIVVDDYETNVLLSARNLPGVEVMKSTAVNPYWMLLFKRIVFTKAALEAFGKRLCPAR